MQIKTNNNPFVPGFAAHSYRSVGGPLPGVNSGGESSGRRDITTRSYQMRGDSWRDEDTSVEAVLSTENVVSVFDWWRWEVIEEVLLMDGLIEVPDQVTLLDTHDSSSVKKVLGSVRDLKIENVGDQKQLVGRRYFSSVADAKDAATKVKEKHIRDGSIGYRVLESVILEPGTTQVINGRTYTAGAKSRLRIATKWQLKEDSLCAIGADGAAKIRTFFGEQTMNFEAWAKRSGFDIAALDEQRVSVLRGVYEANGNATRADALSALDGKGLLMLGTRTDPAPQGGTPIDGQRSGGQGGANPPAGGIDIGQIAEQVALRQQQRATDIRDIATFGGIPDDVCREAINSGISVDAAREQFRTWQAKNRPNVEGGAPAIHIHNNDMDVRTLEASLIMQMNGGESMIRADRTLGDEVADNVLRMNSRSMTYKEFFTMCCRMDNIPFPTGFGMTNGMIRAGISSTTLQSIMSNVANKGLMQKLKAQEVVHNRLCRKATAKDFKETTSYRLTAMGIFQEVNPDGSLKNISMTDVKATNQVQTRGFVFNIDRVMIINDDMGFLDDIPSDISAIDAHTKEYAFFSRLMGLGSPFFNAKNYKAGADTALSIDSISAAKTLFSRQTGKNGLPILVNPKYLVVPSAMGTKADTFCTSAGVYSVGATDKSNLPTDNPVRNFKLTPLSSAYLDNANMPNYSDKAWYLFADPEVLAAFEMVYLNGVENAIIEFGEADFNNLGMSLRAYSDFGVREQNAPAVVKQKGEA